MEWPTQVHQGNQIVQENSTKRKELNEQQQRVLDLLMDPEYKGNIRKAMQAAGYSDTYPVSDFLKGVKDEVIELVKNILAVNGPRAAFELIGVFDNPNATANKNVLLAAKEILDRVGVVKPNTDQNIDLKVPSGGLFILPAKEMKKEEDVGTD